jgi:hypothetical protein
VCSVCGNGRCETDREDGFETCSNCAVDCGECEEANCRQVLFCAFGCFDFAGPTPDISFTCVSNCVAQGCADVQFFVDEAINCAIAEFITCGDLACVQRECAEEFQACLRARCTDMN